MIMSAVVSARQILRFVDEIATKFSPQKIVLFGSYAYGSPSEDSDVDLLIVKEYPGRSDRAAIEIRESTDVGFPLDLIIRSASELDHRTAIEDWFTIEIVQRGIVLYEANDIRVCEKGRRQLRRRLNTQAITQAQPV